MDFVNRILANFGNDRSNAFACWFAGGQHCR
jgi:hypothetical protein